jgi:hypothetical protein
MQAGLSSLFMACMSGHLDVVRLLLANKADANLQDQVHCHSVQSSHSKAPHTHLPLVRQASFFKQLMKEQRQHVWFVGE